MSSIQIYQSFHHHCPHPDRCSWIQPVGVSGFLAEGFISDSEGEHIAHLNKSYCELTTQYQVWKNRSHDFVGFYHYRRYLNFLPSANPHDLHAGPPDESATYRAAIQYLSSDQQFEALQKMTRIFDVITPQKSTLLPSIKSQYTNAVQHRPWQLFEEILQDLYPNGKASLKYFELFAAAPLCNMFVMQTSIFDAYCKDLFSLLDTIYQAIGTPYDDYNNRYPGFLAERFLGFWLAMNKINTAEVPLTSFH